MILKLKYKFFIVFCGLFLMQSSVLAQTSPTELKVNFPEIKGWEKSSIKRYSTPELGYSISYKSAIGSTVTLYVYNNGNKTIPTGVDNDLVKEEFNSAKESIIEFGKQSNYQNVKELKSNRMILGLLNGKVKSLYSLFSLTANNQYIMSEIYLFGYKNNFIKLRDSYALGNASAATNDMEAVLDAVDKLFAK